MPAETHQRGNGGVTVVEMVGLGPVAVVALLVGAVLWTQVGEDGRSTRRGEMT